ncbi:MAG: adenosylmethionine--8-amino-7-oxononanoate transaminase [Planctomycetes bacterium]|nr:adenosylmethionine--8-amino-7-oxononanoate transaminase [Planctomycetota bacterium]
MQIRSKFEETKFLKFDKEHIWHPYTSIENPLPVYHIISASGVRLRLADGRDLIDGMSSWWTAIHGYNHPVLNEAVKKQISKMAHVMFGGVIHEPAVSLADLLINITPPPLQKVFFCDSGSVAVEVAIKMALQYWYTKGKGEKNKLLTIRSGYHGDTFKAMSVCDPANGMHHVFHDAFDEQYFADSPLSKFGEEWIGSDIDSFRSLIEANCADIAAVIMEPIVQGAGGMRFYSPDYLKNVRLLCDQYNVLLILDEIATGFGRTGKLFAAEHAGIYPDIMCVGKALTGGYLGLAATLAIDDISEVISSGDPGVFMHGPTFMANPLSCAVAVESVRLLMRSSWLERVKSIEAQMKQQLMACADGPGVQEVRVLGAIGVVEMKDDVDVAGLQEKFVKKGIWVRPFRNLIYIMPPYIVSEDELSLLTTAITEIVEGL